MTNVIAFKESNGGVGVLTPCDPSLSIEAIAKKDVPTGLPYLILPAEQVNQDLDFSNPHGYGADHGTGSKNYVVGWVDSNTPILETREE